MPSGDDLDTRLGVLREAILGGAAFLSAFREMPFAIFVHSPAEEFTLRRKLQLLFAELQRASLEPVHLSLAELAKESVDRAQQEDGGWQRIYEGERKRRSTKAAVQTVRYALQTAAPLADLVVERLEDANPDRTVTFLGRIGALYPAYRAQALLAALAGRIKVPVVLLFPGRRSTDGGIEFLEGLPSDASSYARVF